MALAAGLFISGLARAAGPAFVQVVAAQPQTSQSSVSVIYSKAQVAGDTNILAIGWGDTTSNITNVTDSKGNVYAVAAPTTRGSSQSQAIYYAKNITAAAANGNTVTVTFNSPAQFVDLRASEYSGLDTANPLDKTLSATGTAGTATTASATTAFSNELIFGAGDTSGAFTAAGTSFTKRLITNPDSDIVEDRIVSAIGSYSASAKQNGAWVMQMATFKAAGSTPDTTPPSVPTGLTGTAASSTQASLSWTASTDNVGVTGYKIYRNGTQVATSSTANFVDTGLSAGTTYTYAVAAFDAAGNTSNQSSNIQVTTPSPDTTAPSIPAGLSATAVSTSEIDLSWSASTDNVGVSGYKVYRNSTLVTTVIGTTYKNTGLAASTAYSFTVSAVDAAGNESAQSTAANATTLAPDTTPPSVPGGLSVNGATSSQLTVSWTASTDDTGVTGYHIFRNGTQITTTTVTNYQDSSLTANTTYSYTVSAVDAAGNESAQSTSASGTTLAGPSFAFPKSVSTNNRYLLDQNGNPYMIVGDSPHSLGVNLSESQMDAYFADRQAHGVNSAWIQVLCNTYAGGRADGSTFDGIAPFTTANDFSTPNPVYFQRLQDMVNIAANHGVTVFLDAMETAGWSSQYQSNGATKDFNFGAYLGNLFKNSPNIVWFTGNDNGGWSDPVQDNEIISIAQGIKSAGAIQLQTLQLNGTISSSLDDQRWSSILNINGAYTYFPTYDEVLHAYNQTPVMPTMMQEANYEFENNTGGPATTNETLRRQEYWSATSGSNAGQLYGNCYTWDCATSWADEQAHLDTPGVTQLQYMENLFTAREWYNLVPDQNHSFLTAGAGTYDAAQDDVLQNDYATAAVTPDGAFGAVYVPTARTITVNLNLLAGPINVRWYDPTNNTFRAVTGSPFATGSGPQQFTTPGLNAEGSGDWVLVLDGNAVPDTTAPNVPAGLTVPGTTGSTASISWTASTDNVGVAGYKVYRNGLQVATTTTTSYTDNGLNQNTTYVYTVAAYDFAGNVSAQSAPINATTTNTAPPPATPAFVQVNSATPQSAQTTVTVPYSQAQTGGNTNIVAISWYSTSATITSVTDNKGNTYQLAAPLTHSSSMYQAIYYAKNINPAAAGSAIVSVTFSTAVQYPDIRVLEYSGIDTVNPVDATSSATGSGNVTSGNITTTKPTELLFGAGATSGLFTAPGTGYTQRIITNPDGDIAEDRVVTSVGTYSATATQSGDEVMQIVAFKAAGQ